MDYEETVEYICELLKNNKEAYAINSADVREFLDNYDDYYEILSKKESVDIDWIITLIKDEN